MKDIIFGGERCPSVQSRRRTDLMKLCGDFAYLGKVSLHDNEGGVGDNVREVLSIVRAFSFSRIGRSSEYLLVASCLLYWCDITLCLG